MIATTLLLAASVAGVETGWQPHEGGGLEYIIQIEPELLSALRAGEALTSEIPPGVEGVRRYRIVVGKQPLPREGASPVPPTETPAPPATPQEPASPPTTETTPTETQPPTTNHQPPGLRPSLAAQPPAEESSAEEYGGEMAPPRILEPPSDAVQTTFKQPAPASPSDRKPPLASSEPPVEGGTALGWTAALLGLTVSLGANLYLAWMWLDARRRYTALVYQREG